MPGDGEKAGAVAIHEYEHISQGHSRLPSECIPGPDELQQQACNECAAHCAVLAGWQSMYLEYNIVIACSLMNKVKNDAARECLACEVGVGSAGPPSQPPCGGTPNTPCH